MKIKGYLFLTVAMFMMTILFFGSESKAAMTSWSAEQPARRCERSGKKDRISVS